MRLVKVNKAEVLEALKENKKHHRKIFEEAVDGYQAQALAILEQHIDAIKSGKRAIVNIVLPLPEDHTSDYEREIRMLELSVDSEVELTQAEFAQYVMDDWNWKHQFLAANAAYSGTARAESDSF